MVQIGFRIAQRSSLLAAVVVTALLVGTAVPYSKAYAEPSWNPFEEADEARRKKARERKKSGARDDRPPTLEAFQRDDRPWQGQRRGSADDRASADRDRTQSGPFGSTPGYLPPAKPGAPLLPGLAGGGVERRELAPVIVEPSAQPPTETDRRNGVAASRRPSFPASPGPGGDADGWRGTIRERDTSRDRTPDRRRPDDTTDRTASLAPERPRGRQPDPAADAAWRRLTFDDFAKRLGQTPAPVGSDLLRILFLSAMTPVAVGAQSIDQEKAKRHALHLAGLYDRGLINVAGLKPAALAQAIQDAPSVTDPSTKGLTTMLATRAALASGDWQTACPIIRLALSDAEGMPRPILAQLLVQGGVCAILGGQPSGASLAARLARDAGEPRETTLALLEAAAEKQPNAPLVEARLDAIDVRIIQAAKIKINGSVIPRMQPSGLAALADSGTDDALIRILAAEQAAKRGIISANALGDAYAAGTKFRRSDPSLPATDRAKLFLEIKRNRAFLQRARAVQNYMDLARRDGLALMAAMAVGPLVAELPRIPEIGWFAETAAFILIAAERTELATEWVALGNSHDGNRRDHLRHLEALIAIADTKSGRAVERSLPDVERLARARRFKPADLHVLATVLDALDFQVPIGLWQTANATPQPKGGHLPPTGTLRELALAARDKKLVETALLTMTAIGSNGPGGTNILALGDAIRALNRSGLRSAARRLAFEALFPIWPRQSPNRPR
ncbi:MAG: hypothetical protein AAFY27_02400 [Pseudomonadota bacterium]